MAAKWLHRNVIITGFTSFFTDVSSEMIYPLLQAFVTVIMAAHKALLGPVLGVIEGVAESTASITKVFSGYVSDRLQERKPSTITGYGTSTLAKFLYLLASLGWGMVLLARFLDRIGKGIRTAPRDALIADSTAKDRQGRAFGFQRGMDFAGAAVGSIICYFLVLHFLDPLTGSLKNLDSYYTIFLISIIPAFIGVAFLFFIKEKGMKTAASAARPQGGAGAARETAASAVRPQGGAGAARESGAGTHAQKGAWASLFGLRAYPAALKVFFLAQVVFTLGNSTNQFLLLRSMTLGAALSTVILMYLVFNTVSSVLSPVFGALADKIGKKKVLLLGYTLYAGIYLAFGFISTQTQFLLWVFWPLYGVYYAFTEGVEKAFVTDLAPAQARGTALGFFHTITGIGLLPASIMAGLLFMLAPQAPFIFGGCLAFAAVIIILLFVRKK
jgi:MFS family permease